MERLEMKRGREGRGGEIDRQDGASSTYDIMTSQRVMLIVQVRRYRNETDETRTNQRMPTADGERERRTLTLYVADQLDDARARARMHSIRR